MNYSLKYAFVKIQPTNYMCRFYNNRLKDFVWRAHYAQSCIILKRHNITKCIYKQKWFNIEIELTIYTVFTNDRLGTSAVYYMDIKLKFDKFLRQ